MLRITVLAEPGSMTYRLEGRLTGEWVNELESCWRNGTESNKAQAIRFDLSQVTSIDPAGKAFLAARHAEGAALVASCCVMRAVVEEFAGNQ